MTCEEIHARSLPEDYLLGRLPPADQEAYERHFFECDRCFAELEALRATASALHPQPSARTPYRAIDIRWLGLAAVLVLAVGTAVVLMRERPAPPSVTTAVAPAPATAEPEAGRTDRSDTLKRLARFEPPPYAPPRLRSAAPDGDFQKGMERYLQRDYDGAVPLLQSASRDAAHADSARFYLGVSLILAGRADEGVRTLNVLAEDPQNVMAEDARFFSAHGHLQRGDVDRAAAALDRTIELQGDREKAARALRAEIDKIR